MRNSVELSTVVGSLEDEGNAESEVDFNDITGKGKSLTVQWTLDHAYPSIKIYE